MKALRFAVSVLIIAAILTLHRTLLPVNNTTVAPGKRGGPETTAPPTPINE
jgi:hypothetical protein